MNQATLNIEYRKYVSLYLPVIIIILFVSISGGSGPTECLAEAQRVRFRHCSTSTSVTKRWARRAQSPWSVPGRTSVWSAPSCWSSTGKSATWSATPRVTGSSQLTSPIQVPPRPVSDRTSGAPHPLLLHLYSLHHCSHWPFQDNLCNPLSLLLQRGPSTHIPGPCRLLCVCCPRFTAPGRYPLTTLPSTRSWIKAFIPLFILIHCKLWDLFT